MKLTIALIINAILLFSGCTEEKKNTEMTQAKKQNKYNIPWEKDLTTALKKAKIENKKIIVMAISKRCKWCKKLKKETLSNPDVLNKLNHYLLVQIDRDIPSEKEQIPKFEHVPAFFFATANKKFYDELKGYFTTEEFLSALKEVEELE